MKKPRKHARGQKPRRPAGSGQAPGIQAFRAVPSPPPPGDSACHPREAFLLDMMKENLSQARHVENERMMFVTLFAALVGVVLAIVIELDSQLLSVVTLVMLMLLNIVSLILTHRWNVVFSHHWMLAQRISCFLLEYDSTKENNRKYDDMDAAFLQSYPYKNRYFFFDNKLGGRGRFYIRTAWLFTGFNICIFILLGVALVHILHPNVFAALFR